VAQVKNDGRDLFTANGILEVGEIVGGKGANQPKDAASTFVGKQALDLETLRFHGWIVGQMAEEPKQKVRSKVISQNVVGEVSGCMSAGDEGRHDAGSGQNARRQETGRSSRFFPCYNRAMRRLRRRDWAMVCLISGAALFGLRWANAQQESSPDVPSAIQAPAGERVVLVAHASGSQIYTCQPGTENKFAWSLKGPDAELKDAKGKVIGKHFAGPTWKLEDGSEVTGKASGHVESPDPGSIPWLRVNVVAHSGEGALTNVSTIQRIHTQGGQSPTSGCDESHAKAESKSSYTADYYFYAPGK